MAKHRFHIPPSAWDPGSLSLPEEEARHCLEVLRCREGDRVGVFNGQGEEAEAEIVSARKGSVALKALLVSSSPKPPAAITLGQAVPKGRNMDLIIQKATELGVSTVVPLLSERTVVRLDPGEAERKRVKWQRVALEACKQSGQNWLPRIEAPVAAESFVREARDEFRLVAAIDPGSRPLKQILAEWDEEHRARPRAATVMVGPEGDFTPAEISRALSEGFAPLSLGPIILRSETAAIYALSVVAYELMGR